MTKEHLLNPCKNCELRDFCGSDDCGMHLFDLDVNEPETEPEDEDEDFEVVVDPYWNR